MENKLVKVNAKCVKKEDGTAYYIPKKTKTLEKKVYEVSENGALYPITLVECFAFERKNEKGEKYYDIIGPTSGAPFADSKFLQNYTQFCNYIQNCRNARPKKSDKEQKKTK